MSERINVSGKFLRHGTRHEKFFVKGFSYGPFVPNQPGAPFPEPHQTRRDLEHMRSFGANTLRVYFPPPPWLIDQAADQGLKVLIDVPWESHRCFFEDREALQRARNIVRDTARTYGGHPAVLAISVANELPVDVVRFQGRHRVEKFLEDLLGIVKEESPDCLATYVNSPTTEFLSPRSCDFYCFNVYVHDERRFAAYLDRLQHIAGGAPLVIGEFGVDSRREGDVAQAAKLSSHVRQVFRHGLAGSIIFSYTDGAYAGCSQNDDLSFGITRCDRNEKPAAAALRKIWNRVPFEAKGELPKASVIVCSYDGGRTLHECLNSLMRLDYPDYEIILVDDGSTDDTSQIADEFPQIIYHRQENRGLGVARNVGAALATGEIVAYTDSDCVADEDWLTYLVQAMIDQRVDAIGGPNVTPESDGWMAKCIAASPGNPSHVMLDDRCAEHVPGCNMAFRRSTLLALGGFDAQFCVAGDDVDICWRILDAGLHIGFAPGAMVWHHRRTTIQAYARQQKGYGRSEAMVHFKHPQRCGVFGRSSWKGIIYGDGAVGLPLLPERIDHGRFGGGLFQTIYRHNDYGMWSCLMSLEWHLAVLFILLLALLFPPLAAVGLLMWSATFAQGIRSALAAPLPTGNSRWCRVLIAYLYIMQPIWRGWNRLTYLLRHKKLPLLAQSLVGACPASKRKSSTARELYWDDQQGWGRMELLEGITHRARSLRWAGDFDNSWSTWDIKLTGDRWHNVTISAATEELGWPRRFTRARCEVQLTVFAQLMAAVCIIWCSVSLAAGQAWGMVLGFIAGSAVMASISISRHRCLRESVTLVWQSAEKTRTEFLDRIPATSFRVGAESDSYERNALAVLAHQSDDQIAGRDQARAGDDDVNAAAENQKI